MSSRKKKGQFMEETQAAFGSDCVVVSEKTTSTHAPLGRSSSFSIFTGGLMSLTSKMSKGSNSPRKSPTKPKFPPLPQNDCPLNEMNNSPKSPIKQKANIPKCHTSLSRKLSASFLSTFSSQPSPLTPPRLHSLSHRNYSSSSSSSSSSSDSDSSSSSDSDTATDEGDHLDEEKIETSRPNDYRLAQEKKFVLDLSAVVLGEGVQLTKFSCVSNLMDTIVILASTPGTPPLDAETRVFTSDRKCIGVVYETFGPVKQPFYSILFDSPQAIRAMGIKIGQPLYCSPADSQLTQFVFLKDIKKGSDASWIDDNEPPAEAVEFSDDETELRERAERKAVSRANKQSNTGASHFNAPLSNSNGSQETSYSPMDAHNQQVTQHSEVMDTHFTNPNTQISPHKKNISFILPPTSQPQISSAPYSSNTGTVKQITTVPLEQEGIFPIVTDSTEQSVLPTDSTEPNLSTEIQMNTVPLEQEGIFPIVTDSTEQSVLPTDSTEPNLSTEIQMTTVPLEQEGIFPIATDSTEQSVLPTDSTEPNLPTEIQMTTVPLEQEGIFPIATDSTEQSVLPTDSTEPNLPTEIQMTTVPLEQEGIFPIATDSTEQSVLPTDSTEQGLLPTDSTEPNLSTEIQMTTVPLEQEGIFPIATDSTEQSVLPTDSTEPNLPTEIQMTTVPLEQEGIFPIVTDSTEQSVLPTDSTEPNLSTEIQMTTVPLEQEGIFPIATDSTEQSVLPTDSTEQGLLPTDSTEPGLATGNS